MDYVLTGQGEEFLCQALATCERFGVTWEQLWSHAREGEEARRFLGFNPEEEEESTGRLLGAAVVVQVLHKVAAREQTLDQGKALLEQAHLLTDDNISIAAETLGLSVESVRSVLSPPR